MSDIQPSHAESEYVRHRAVLKQFQAIREGLEPNPTPSWTRHTGLPLWTCVIIKADLRLALSARTACPAGNRSSCPVATGRSKTDQQLFGLLLPCKPPDMMSGDTTGVSRLALIPLIRSRVSRLLVTEPVLTHLTQLQRHVDQVVASPEVWMPWNYRAALT